MPIRPGNNNHVEMVHRPGEGDLACKLFTLLGCPPVDLDAPFAGAVFHSSPDLTLWVSEVTEEQWAFECWLQEQMDAGGTEASRGWVKDFERYPQKYPHFGIGTTTLSEWEDLVNRLACAAKDDPELRGRIDLPLIKRPEDEGSIASMTDGKMCTTFYQAFLRTDIISAGLLTLGQGIDIQHYLENDPDYRPGG